MARLAIIPVLDYADVGVSSRAAKLDATASGRADAYRRALAELGLTGLEHVPDLEGLVSLRALLVSGHLDRMLELVLRDTAPDARTEEPITIDYVLALGIALEMDGRAVAWPGCCSDLSVLVDLDRCAARARVGEPVSTGFLWLGHDASSLSVEPTEQGHALLVGEDSEDTPIERFEVTTDEMARALDAAWADVAAFEQAMARWLDDPRLHHVSFPVRDAGDDD